MSVFLLDNYRLLVNGYFPPSGWHILTPLNRSLTFLQKREEKLGIFRKELTTTLKFKGIDFEALQSLEHYRCMEYDVVIQKKCDDGEWQEYFRGVYRPTECKWDYDACLVEVTVIVKDPFYCWLDRYDPVNLLSYGTNVTMRWDEGWFQIKTCQSAVNVPPAESVDFSSFTGIEEAGLVSQYCIDRSEGWIPTRQWVTEILGDQRRIQSYTTEWVRVYLPDYLTPKYHLDQWIDVPGGKARPPGVREWVYSPEHHPDGSAVSSIPFTYHRYKRYLIGEVFTVRQRFITSNLIPGLGSYTLENQDINIDNGRLLNDVLIEMFGQLCTGINLKSNFLNINPSGESPDNAPYRRMADILNNRNLAIWHITDVARHRAASNATGSDAASRFNVDKLMQDLQLVFNLAFDYDYSTGTLIIEHISFFKERNRINLIDTSLSKFIVGKHKYYYDKEKVVPEERFIWCLPSDPEFNLTYRYNGSCVNYKLSPEDKTTTYLFTDIGYLERQIYEVTSGSDSTAIDQYKSTNALFMAVIDQAEFIQYMVWDDAFDRPNGLLSYPSLEILYRWDRPAETGELTMLGASTNVTFETWRLNKIQDSISVPMTCEDIDEFNPHDNVKTQMGWGEIEEAEITVPENRIKLKLRHV